MNEIKYPKMEIHDCKKNATTDNQISECFNADETCMSCDNIIYKDGVISCKYSRVN